MQYRPGLASAVKVHGDPVLSSGKASVLLRCNRKMGKERENELSAYFPSTASLKKGLNFLLQQLLHLFATSAGKAIWCRCFNYRELQSAKERNSFGWVTTGATTMTPEQQTNHELVD